jgi:hypothetical protein
MVAGLDLLGFLDCLASKDRKRPTGCQLRYERKSVAPFYYRCAVSHPTNLDAERWDGFPSNTSELDFGVCVCNAAPVAERDRRSAPSVGVGSLNDEGREEQGAQRLAGSAVEWRPARSAREGAPEGAPKARDRARPAAAFDWTDGTRAKDSYPEGRDAERRLGEGASAPSRA